MQHYPCSNEERHIKVRTTVDDDNIVVVDVKCLFDSPPRNIPTICQIVSSCYEEKNGENEKKIEKVRDSMCSPDLNPSLRRDIVEILEAADCTNIDLRYGINACFIPKDDASSANLVWFQCPWIPSSRDPAETAIADLILGFLGSAADNCAPGTFVCVGITKQEYYMRRYCLELILGANLDSCTLDQYEFLGIDDLLINKLLYYGYKHQGYKDIHDYIKNDHVTLVFRLY